MIPSWLLQNNSYLLNINHALSRYSVRRFTLQKSVRIRNFTLRSLAEDTVTPEPRDVQSRLHLENMSFFGHTVLRGHIRLTVSVFLINKC